MYLMHSLDDSNFFREHRFPHVRLLNVRTFNVWGTDEQLTTTCSHAAVKKQHMPTLLQESVG